MSYVNKTVFLFFVLHFCLSATSLLQPNITSQSYDAENNRFSISWYFRGQDYVKTVVSRKEGENSFLPLDTIDPGVNSYTDMTIIEDGNKYQYGLAILFADSTLSDFTYSDPITTAPFDTSGLFQKIEDSVTLSLYCKSYTSSPRLDGDKIFINNLPNRERDYVVNLYRATEEDGRFEVIHSFKSSSVPDTIIDSVAPAFQYNYYKIKFGYGSHFYETPVKKYFSLGAQELTSLAKVIDYSKNQIVDSLEELSRINLEYPSKEKIWFVYNEKLYVEELTGQLTVIDISEKTNPTPVYYIPLPENLTYFKKFNGTLLGFRNSIEWKDEWKNLYEAKSVLTCAKLSIESDTLVVDSMWDVSRGASKVLNTRAYDDIEMKTRILYESYNINDSSFYLMHYTSGTPFENIHKITISDVDGHIDIQCFDEDRERYYGLSYLGARFTPYFYENKLFRYFQTNHTGVNWKVILVDDLTMTTEIVGVPQGLMMWGMPEVKEGIILENEKIIGPYPSFERLYHNSIIDTANNLLYTYRNEYIKIYSYELENQASSIKTTNLVDNSNADVRYQSSVNQLVIATPYSQNISIRLFSLNGKVLKDENLYVAGTSLVSLPALAAGVYVLTLDTKKGPQSQLLHVR